MYHINVNATSDDYIRYNSKSEQIGNRTGCSWSLHNISGVCFLLGLYHILVTRTEPCWYFESLRNPNDLARQSASSSPDKVSDERKKIQLPGLHTHRVVRPLSEQPNTSHACRVDQQHNTTHVLLILLHTHTKDEEHVLPSTFLGVNPWNDTCMSLSPPTPPSLFYVLELSKFCENKKMATWDVIWENKRVKDTWIILRMSILMCTVCVLKRNREWDLHLQY